MNTNESAPSSEKRGFACLQDADRAADFEQAFYWLSIAESEGSEKARLAVGEMYARSLGVEGNLEEAESRGWSESRCSLLGGAAESPEHCAVHHGRASNGAVERASIDTCPACGTSPLARSAVFPGAFFCAEENGGCKSHLFLPVVEQGLERGLSIQPYTEPSRGSGHPVRSFFGHCVHTLKYDGRASEGLRLEIVDEIVRRLTECRVIERVLAGCSVENVVIVPAPSSVRRAIQPVSLLSEKISNNRFDCQEALVKRSRTESKNRAKGAEFEPGEITCDKNVVAGRDVLLIDDTYGEGATLRACIRALKDSGANDVYYLSLCKNIYGGMKGGAKDDDSIH